MLLVRGDVRVKDDVRPSLTWLVLGDTGGDGAKWLGGERDSAVTLFKDAIKLSSSSSMYPDTRRGGVGGGDRLGGPDNVGGDLLGGGSGGGGRSNGEGGEESNKRGDDIYHNGYLTLFYKFTFLCCNYIHGLMYKMLKLIDK